VAIKKINAYFELDGKEHGPFRVGMKTKLQYEKTAKARGWDVEDTPFTTALFWAWHAGKEAGAHDLSYEIFADAVTDAVVETLGDVESDGLDLDPTQTAPTTL
jgi:hypothetical protein